MSCLGFSGTRHGMKALQWETVRCLLAMMDPDEVHHGDCLGADSQFHDLALEQYSQVDIHIHPPDNPVGRANRRSAIIYAPRPYLERNRAIVHASDALIATPRESEEQQRSGTWATVRYAREKGIPLFIVLPDGELL